MSDFRHLHVHTEYSLLDGFAKIDDLLDKCVEYGMDSVAITDHGSMFGVIDFYKKAKAKGIKPIIGCEVYISPNSYLSKKPEDKKRYHLILLAENWKGYQNLIKIVSEGYVNGFYYKPRVDKDILSRYSQGIICLSACLAGEVQRYLQVDDYNGAKKAALEYRDIFGTENFYLELQDHGILEQKRVNLSLERLSRETGIPLVATNDVHYINREDSKVHDLILCIGTGATVNQEKRMKFPTDQFYFKSGEEMEDLFKNNEEAIRNTGLIADRCQVDFVFHDMHLPHYEVAGGLSHKEYLKKLVDEGLEKKYGIVSPKMRERAAYELSVIEEMGFTDYFLIVWDFIAYAKSKNIPVGPGRGSAAGSIVSYALDITNIDPLKYDLLFERFLNPQRVSMPDIDIDFCYERREEVIEYVKRKYGADRVSQIVTFGTMAARNAIRDVGRAMEIDYATVDKVAKQVPQVLKMTIRKALDMSLDLKNSYESDGTIRKLLDMAMAVEGLPRHTSTHAAGVVIAPVPVDEIVPLSLNGDQVTTQYNMIELEELGLLKMDFLGLRTLTVISDAVKLVKYNYGIDVDIDKIDENDPKVLDIFAKANTIGIFQFESDGMRNFLKGLKPDRFDDLVAANSLFRPGPMNEIPNYIRYRHNPQEVKYPDPSLEDILDVTYGTIVYQEQVMQIVQKLGGFSLGEADNLRRAMGKKKMSVMEENREYFVHGKLEGGRVVMPGAVRNGVKEETANKIFDLMIEFAKYAFNKSHSAAYAYVAMQTAWLKVYYPKEFMAALLSSVMGVPSKVNQYIKEAKRLNIDILAPDINSSYRKFSVDGDKIRLGLSVVKNVGHNFIDNIVEERKNGAYTSLEDFINRLSNIASSGMNKKALEALILSGACDSLGLKRSQMMQMYMGIIESNTSGSRKNIKGQEDIFSMLSQEEKRIAPPEIGEFRTRDLLRYEKEYLGIYVSGHPYQPFEEIVEKVVNFSLLDLLEYEESLERLDKKAIIFGGIVTVKKEHFTKNNKVMAFLTVEDLYGSIEVVVFPDVYQREREKIEEDAPLLIRGSLQVSDAEDLKIIMRDASLIKRENSQNNGEREDRVLYLQMDSKNKALIDETKALISSYRGKSKVVFYFSDMKKAFDLKGIYADLDRQDFIDSLGNLVGINNLVIK